MNKMKWAIVSGAVIVVAVVILLVMKGARTNDGEPSFQGLNEVTSDIPTWEMSSKTLSSIIASPGAGGRSGEAETTVCTNNPSMDRFEVVDFQYDSASYKVFFFAHNCEDAAHVEAAGISAVVYKSVSQGWQLVDVRPNVVEIGSFGQAPEQASHDVVQIGPQRLARLWDVSFTNQGVTEGNRLVFEVTPGQFKARGLIQVHQSTVDDCAAEDELGEEVDEQIEGEPDSVGTCWAWDGDLDVLRDSSPTPEGYFDIQRVITAVSGSPPDEPQPTVYRYREGSYKPYQDAQ